MASVVRLDGAVSGPVTAVGATTLTVLGQTVAVNANGLAGPITQFGNGYTQIGDIGVGDAVEIHGVLVRQGTAAVVQATRIDKLAGTADVPARHRDDRHPRQRRRAPRSRSGS